MPTLPATLVVIPAGLWDFRYALESFELEIDMGELPASSGPRMTSVDELAAERFGGFADSPA